jgi:cell division protein FtsN
MKEFYVLNLDWRRLAIIAGGALVALGITLMIGMSIGRGQGERTAAQVTDELGAKPGLPGDPTRAGAEKFVFAAGPTPGAESQEPPATALLAQPKSDIPLQADPLVAGPPRKKMTRKTTHRLSDSSQANEATPIRSRKKKTRTELASQETSEVAGSVDHSKKRKKIAHNSETNPEAARFTIQVAAFKRAGDASGLIARLKEEGIKARSEKTGGFYLVTVGRSKSKDKLNKALARLKELEYAAYIRKIRNDSEET